MAILTGEATVRLLPTIGEQLIEAGAAFNGTQYRVVRLAAELDASDEWLLTASSASRWIADTLDICVSTAREWVRVGRALRHLPDVDEAFAANRLSYSKVRTLTRIATPDNEAELLELATSVPASRLSVELAGWLNRNEPPEERKRREERERVFRSWTDPFGMVCGFFRLPPLAATKPLAAIDLLVLARSQRVALNNTESARNASAGASGRWPSLGQQRADAFVELAETGGAQVRSEVVLHVRGDGCTLDDGTPIDQSDVEQIAPHSFIRALVHDAEGRPINASSRRRHPTTRQKRVVKERDRRCVDCGSTDLLQYDHDPDFELSRRTVVDELRLRCAPCHHRRHRTP